MTITVKGIEELQALQGKPPLGPSDWRQIDQNQVKLFADLTGDHQWIHVDVERATRELGGTIVFTGITRWL